MIDLIISWVMGIVFTTLFASFLELLLPSSSMQKFVRVIMGLLIMLAILNPVIGFLEHAPLNGDVTALAPRLSGTAPVEEAAKASTDKRDQLIKDVYRRDLAKQMHSLVMGIEGVAQANVDVELGVDQAGLTKISRVIVIVRPGAAKKAVEKVVIGISPSAPVLQQETVVAIQRRLSELYQLQAQQIIVKSMQS
jgi:stage III sporulation protein AF